MVWYNAYTGKRIWRQSHLGRYSHWRSFTQPQTCLTTTINSVKTASAVCIEVSSPMVHKYIHLNVSSQKLKRLRRTYFLFITSSCEALFVLWGILLAYLVFCWSFVFLHVAVRRLKVWRNREDIDSATEVEIQKKVSWNHWSEIERVERWREAEKFVLVELKCARLSQCHPHLNPILYSRIHIAATKL